MKDPSTAAAIMAQSLWKDSQKGISIPKGDVRAAPPEAFDEMMSSFFTPSTSVKGPESGTMANVADQFSSSGHSEAKQRADGVYLGFMMECKRAFDSVMQLVDKRLGEAQDEREQGSKEIDVLRRCAWFWFSLIDVCGVK